MAKTESTVFVFDIGSSSTDRESKDAPTFYDLQQKCIDTIILRKIFIKPQDEVALFISGTYVEDNELHYDNISLAIPMTPMNWNILKYIRNSIDPPNDDVNTDWLDALFVAMDYLRSNDVPGARKKIILFNTLTTPVKDSENIAAAISGIKQLNIELIVISTKVPNRLDDSDANQSQTLLQQVVKETQGIFCSFDDFIPHIIISEKKVKRRVAWKADLEIGSQIRIKIAAYIYMRDDDELPKWAMKMISKVRLEQDEIGLPITGPTQPQPLQQSGPSQAQLLHQSGPSQTQPLQQSGPSQTQPLQQSSQLQTHLEPCVTKTEHYLHDNVVPREEVEEKLMKAYRYGGAVVPFEGVQDYEGGGKGFRLIGFAKESCIKDEYFAGGGIWLVAPQNDTLARKQMTALVQALRNLHLTMIVRYTYNVKSTPKLMCMYPNSRSTKHNTFFMQELFFKDNQIDVHFPRLQGKRTELNDEQYKAIDQFMDAMDLTEGMNENASNDNNVNDKQKSKEHFKHLLNPSTEHAYRALAHRHLKPDEPLLSPSDTLLAILTPPHKEEAKQHIDTLKSLFTLETAKVSSKETFYAKMRQIDDSGNASMADSANTSGVSTANTSNVSCVIGTIDPVKDFSKCLVAGVPFHRLAMKMQEVIENLIIYNIGMSEPFKIKIHKSLIAYRAAAIEKAPYLYNEWITVLQKTMNNRCKADLWQSLIAEKGYGLITSIESALSTVTEADAERFNENKNEGNLENDDGIDMEHNKEMADAVLDLFG